MTERALAERSSAPAEGAERRAANAPRNVTGTLLAAGNAAVQRLARQVEPAQRAPARAIQRCGAGGCTCGGKCGGHAVEEEELLGAAAIRRAVARRKAPPSEARRRRLSRTVTVRDPGSNIPNPGGAGVVQTNARTIELYVQRLCPSGSVTVDGATGRVSLGADFCTWAALPPGIQGPPGPSPAHSSSTPTSCNCLCDMIGSAHPWTIVVDDVDWPHTDFDDHDAANGRTPGGTGGSVTAPSPNSPRLWGAGTAGGGTLDIEAWLVLGHELCGHGWMGDRGTHGPDHGQPRGRGGHQETVRRENLIRAEHGIALRGGFKDPNCGESYWRDRATNGPVQWSSYRAECIKWRREYNRRHGTRYTITDRIP